MARANALRRNDFQRGDPFKKGFQKLNKFAATIGEADSIIVQEASKALVKGLKKVLRQKGPSAPGQPPGKRSGRLARSIGREVVAGQMRVGTGHFTAPWLQFGLLSTKRHKLEPRPFMEAGVDAALVEIKGASLSGIRKKTKELAD